MDDSKSHTRLGEKCSYKDIIGITDKFEFRL